MGNVNMEAYQVHYEGNKSVADKIKEFDGIGQQIDDLSDIVSIKADRIDIAPNFSEESSYSAGDLVYHSGRLWQFSVDHAAGAWDVSEVSPTTVAAEFNQLNNTLTSKGQLDWSQAAEVTTPYTPTKTGQLIVSGVATGDSGTISLIDNTTSLVMNTVQANYRNTGLGISVMVVGGHEYQVSTYNTQIDKVVFVPVI